MFQSEELLHDISALRRPYSLSGIDGTSSDGLQIDRCCGMFRDFSKLGRSIGCSPVASANVLSMGDCLEKGYQVQYSSNTDEFIVNADVVTCVLKRKLHPTGRKSKHYAADMDDYPVSASMFVRTVSENLTTYSKREIDDFRRARKFQESVLGHFSTVDAINIINSGVQNCAIIAQDILRANLINGPSIASLKGETKKQVSTIAGVRLVPRVTQVQQTLDVDLFFVNQLSQCIMMPTRFVFTSFISDRSLQTVTAALNGFIKKVFKLF